MCPFLVSIGQMKGTTISSRTLLTATHTTAITDSGPQDCFHRRCRYSRKSGLISPSCSWTLLVVVAAILFSSSCSHDCEARRHTRMTSHGSDRIPNQSSPPQDPSAQRQHPFPPGSDNDGKENHDLDEYYIDEKEDDVKTIRYANGKAESEEKKGKEVHRKAHHGNNHHHHHSKHISSPSKAKADVLNVDVDENSFDNEGSNDLQVQVNVKKGTGRSPSFNEIGKTDKEVEEVMKTASGIQGANLFQNNNDVQSPQLDSRSVKNLADEVADSILTEADRLYTSMEGGDLSSQVRQLPSPSETGDYILCD